MRHRDDDKLTRKYRATSVDSVGRKTPRAEKKSPIRFLTDRRLDFAPTTLRKSFIVAASDSGTSTFLCKSLWQTGRFGAPWEYLNARFQDTPGTLATPADQSVATTMMKRLGANSPSEYIAKLVQCRTSPNGVFGLRARFDDFESAIEEVPELLHNLAPVTYIYIERRDKLTQAASVIRGLLASRGMAGAGAHYERDLISKCLGRLERQRLAWLRWFEANKIDPAVVYYEDANADIASVVTTCAKLLKVAKDAASPVGLPPFQADKHEPDEWALRFAREVERGIDIRAAEFAADGNLSRIMVELEPVSVTTAEEPPDALRAEIQAHERQQLPQPEPAPQDGAAAAPPAAASRGPARRAPDFTQLPRYQQIIVGNRELLRNANVLDLMSGGGLQTLAALDAGAAYVVGVDPRPARVATAWRTVASHGVGEEQCRFVNMDIVAALNDTEPGAFDVIIARGVLETLDAREFFAYLQYLRPKHVILDTRVAAGNGPLLRFSWREAQPEFPAEANDRYTVVMTPTHDLITLLCDGFGFQWRLVDNPQAAQRDAARPQTYVLDRME
jgi:LPS sulfotransferase NodH/2-polyprenyl-3-methyl-5-hydroxy-6-metoxy-1,4-benzoquinol methylase